MNDTRALLLVATLTVTSAVLSAHHSAAAYASSSIVLKNATVTDVVWANPHTILTFSVKNAKGEVTTWRAESGSPSAQTRVGWNRNSVKAGDAVTVALYPARNGARVGRLAKVTFPDGRELLDSQNRNAVTQ